MNNIPTLASRLNGLSIANVAASSHSYSLNRQRCALRRSPAWPAGGARRSTRAPRARRWPPPSQPHASGPSSCGRPPVQSVRRPLPHLVAYGRKTVSGKTVSNSVFCRGLRENTMRSPERPGNGA